MSERSWRTQTLLSKLSLILVFLWGLSFLSSCTKNPSAKTQTEQTILSFVGALKKGDVEEAKNYILVDSDTLDALNREETKTIATLWFNQVDIAFADDQAKLDENATKTTVPATITAPDAKALAARVEEQLNRKLTETTSLSQEEATQLIASLMLDAVKGDLPKTSREVDVQLEKDENGAWKIIPDQAFLGALSGGLDTLQLS